MKQKSIIVAVVAVLTFVSFSVSQLIPATTAGGILASDNLGGNIPISTFVGGQEAAVVAYDSKTNQYLVVWQDARGSVNRIYGQRLAGNGNLVGSNFIVTDLSPALTAYQQLMPSVAYNAASGEYLVVWSDDRNKGNNWNDADIFGRRVSAEGVPQGADFLITDEPRDQTLPRVSCNSNANECLVVWTDKRDYESIGYNIWGKRVAGNGSLAGPEIAISLMPDDQIRPSVSFNSSLNRYLVSWFDNVTLSSGDNNIRGQLIGADGALVGDNFTVAIAPGDQMRPVIASNTQDNEFVVVWYDLRSGPVARVYGQRVSGNGSVSGGNFLIAEGANNQYSPYLAYDPVNNNYRVVWYDLYAEPTAALLSVVIDSTGNIMGAKTELSRSARYPVLATVAYNTQAKEYMVVWQDGRNYSSSQYDIYGQRMATVAAPAPTPTATSQPTATPPRTGLDFTINIPIILNGFSGQ